MNKLLRIATVVSALSFGVEARAQSNPEAWSVLPVPITDEFVAESNIIFGFGATGEYGRLIFTASRKPITESPSGSTLSRQYNWYPGILTEVAPGQWTLLAPPLGGNGYVHVSRSQSGRYVIALLDNLSEAPANALEVLRSADGGRTWERPAAIPKPVYMSYVRDLMFDETTGIGKLYIIQPDATAFPQPGMHVYQTVDWGRTWTKTEYVRGTMESKSAAENTEPRPLANLSEFVEIAVGPGGNNASR